MKKLLNSFTISIEEYDEQTDDNILRVVNGVIDEILFGDDGRSISFKLDNEVLSQAGYDLIGESSTLYIGYEHNPDADLKQQRQLFRDS